MSEPKCDAGCSRFYGGEIRHLKTCPFYPESFTRMYDEAQADLAAARAERDALRVDIESKRTLYKGFDRDALIRSARQQQAIADALRAEVERLRANDFAVLRLFDAWEFSTREGGTEMLIKNQHTGDGLIVRESSDRIAENLLWHIGEYFLAARSALEVRGE